MCTIDGPERLTLSPLCLYLIRPQAFRLLPRYVSAIVIVFLPLATEEHLKSTDILGVIAALL